MKKLEERLAEALGLSAGLDGSPADEGAREKIHAALQLARREGFEAGAQYQGSKRICYAAQDEYPLTRKVEVPRMENDPHDKRAAQWKAEVSGTLVRITGPRCRLWADLLDNPTKVEEQPIREDEAL